jgi:hypothetical protein
MESMMIDFAGALDEGIQSVSRARDARKEIDDVFDQLSKQVMKSKKGKLSIKREFLLTNPPSGIVEVSRHIVESFSLSAKPREKSWFIVASNPKVPNTEQRIAQWTQDSSGYPCRIFWGGQEHICEDKEGLTNCLGDLLRDPEVAEVLLGIMNAKPDTQKAPTQ